MNLDTNAVSALLDGDQALGDLLAAEVRHHLPLQVVAECESGFLGLTNPGRLRVLFRKLEAQSILLVPDRETASVYAAIKNELRLRGKPLPVNDVWIAAAARQYELAIVSRDAHFDAVPGIRRVSW